MSAKEEALNKIDEETKAALLKSAEWWQKLPDGMLRETWDGLKSQGSDHYKTGGGVEPIDLYFSGGMLYDFCLCSIVKYAFRQRRSKENEFMPLGKEKFISDLDKVIHYAGILKEKYGK